MQTSTVTQALCPAVLTNEQRLATCLSFSTNPGTGRERKKVLSLEELYKELSDSSDMGAESAETGIKSLITTTTAFIVLKENIHNLFENPEGK